MRMWLLLLGLFYLGIPPARAEQAPLVLRGADRPAGLEGPSILKGEPAWRTLRRPRAEPGATLLAGQRLWLLSPGTIRVCEPRNGTMVGERRLVCSSVATAGH